MDWQHESDTFTWISMELWCLITGFDAYHHNQCVISMIDWCMSLVCLCAILPGKKKKERRMIIGLCLVVRRPRSVLIAHERSVAASIKKNTKLKRKKKDRIKSISIQLIYIDAPQGFKDDVPHQFIFVQLFMRPLITVFSWRANILILKFDR